MTRTLRNVRLSGGFTLIELMTVAAIIVVLAALTIPAISAFSESQRIRRSLDELSRLLEFAKAEAMARDTYVWVAFQNVGTSDPANRSGNAEVDAMAFFSTDSTPTARDSYIRPLSKVVRLEGVKLVEGYGGSALSGQLQEMLDATRDRFYQSGDPAYAEVNAAPVPLFSSTTNTSETKKAVPTVGDVTFATPESRTITFTPQGEALFVAEPNVSDGFIHVIDLGIKRMSGDMPNASNPDDAALWLYGATGRLREWRLQ